MNHASSPLSLTLALLILNIMVNSCLFRINFLFVFFFTIFFLGKINLKICKWGILSDKRVRGLWACTVTITADICCSASNYVCTQGNLSYPARLIHDSQLWYVTLCTDALWDTRSFKLGVNSRRRLAVTFTDEECFIMETTFSDEVH